jgi:hypothetical protein
MKTVRQLVSFVLGFAVGVCLYSLLKLRPLSPARLLNAPAQMRANYQSLRTPWVQRSLPSKVCVPVRLHPAKHIRAVTLEVAEGRSQVKPAPNSVIIAEPVAAKAVAAVNDSPAPPPPKIFKTIGYVEKAGGQLEAIILQENEIQVVHIGDLIAERYRVTKVYPESVAAIDETLVQSPMAKPNGTESKDLTAAVAQQPTTPPVTLASGQPEASTVAAEHDHLPNMQSAEPVSAVRAVDAEVQPTTPPGTVMADQNAPTKGADPAVDSLGYVQKADGKIEAIVADGDTVRLVPDTPTVTLAQSTPRQSQEEGAIPTRDSTTPAAVPATNVAMADSSVHPSGVSARDMASVIQQASYQVPTTIPGPADRSAVSWPSMYRESAATMNAASDPAVSRWAKKLGTSSGSLAKSTVTMKPLGFVVKADGELAAILSQDDEVYIVRQGDRFAGRYRAVSVSADAVEVEKEPPRQAAPPPLAAPPASPDLLSATALQGPPPFSNEGCLDCRSNEFAEESAKVLDDPLVEVESPPPRTQKDSRMQSASAKEPRQRSAPVLKQTTASPDSATFVFQTLGYVETQDGEIQAIVADGPEVYLVKQGETFADQYRATSVDPILVLAVKVPPGHDVRNFLSAQTESSGKPASKRLYGYLHFPSSGVANIQALHEVGASGSPVLTDLGVNLLGSSLTGLDPQAHFFTADNPNGGF